MNSTGLGSVQNPARAHSQSATKSAYDYTYNKADNQSQDYFSQLENIAKKERFGLFSQPPPLAVLDKYGNPIQQGGPKNFYTNPKLQSQVEPSLFQVPSSILQGDPYRDTFKSKQIQDKQRVDSIPHGKPFKPTDVHKSLQNKVKALLKFGIILQLPTIRIGSQYDHMKDYDDKTYNTRDASGSIVTGPKGFLTNPHKKGMGNTTVGHLFNPVSYGSDPFHRAQEMDVQERAEHQGKVLDSSKPFCSSNKTKGVFNDSRAVYGQDRAIAESRRLSYNYRPAAHPTYFKHGDKPKMGYNKTIGKFPEYSEEGEIPRPWKQTIPSMTQGAWKPNSQGTFSRPSPSIASMSMNKNKISSFRR